MRTASRTDVPGHDPMPVAPDGCPGATHRDHRVTRACTDCRHRSARLGRPRRRLGSARDDPQRNDARPGVGLLVGHRRTTRALLEQPAAGGDGQGHREGRDLLAPGHRAHLAGPPGDQALGELLERHRAVGVAEGGQLAVDDGRAVVRRRLERRVRHDEPVDGGDAEHRRRPGGHLAQRPRPGRPVEQDAVTVAGEEHRHDPRAAVDDGGEGAGEHLVEQGVERLALAPPALGVPAQPLGGLGGAPGVARAGARGVRDDAQGGRRVPQQLLAHAGGPRHEGTAAVGAGALEVLGAPRAERALGRADDGSHLVGRQVGVAALAPRSHLEPAHRVILSCRTDSARHEGWRSAVGRALSSSSAPSPSHELAHAEIQWCTVAQDQYRRRMPRTAPPVELALDVADGPAPLRHRIADAVVAELRTGRLRPGDTLPSTRALASALGLSRGPVVAAYDELAAAGFVVSRAGSGVRVAPGADRAAVAGAVTHVHTPEPGVRATAGARATGAPLGPAPRPPGHLARRRGRVAAGLAGRRVRRAGQRRRRGAGRTPGCGGSSPSTCGAAGGWPWPPRTSSWSPAWGRPSGHCPRRWASSAAPWRSRTRGTPRPAPPSRPRACAWRPSRSTATGSTRPSCRPRPSPPTSPPPTSTRSEPGCR